MEQQSSNQVGEGSEATGFSRTSVLLRLLYTVLFLIVFEILRLIIQVVVVVQYIFLLVAKKHSEQLRTFSNKVSVYAYRVLRYLTLNENTRPYPFSDFPANIDLPADEVLFEKGQKSQPE